MLISRQKKKENIAEYVIYMWQLEDLLRAFNLDINLVKKNIVDQYDQPDDVKQEMLEWYQMLIDMMHKEGVEKSGHTQMVMNIVHDVNDLHNELMRSPAQIKYNALFYSVLPALADFRAKSNSGADVDDVHLALTAMYEVMLMRLQKREISEDTLKAVTQIGQFLADLSDKYKKSEADELKL